MAVDEMKEPSAPEPRPINQYESMAKQDALMNARAILDQMVQEEDTALLEEMDEEEKEEYLAKKRDIMGKISDLLPRNEREVE